MKLNYQSPSEAIKAVKSGQRVFVHGSAATPVSLLKALFDRSEKLETVE
jgi:hypothetical protein